MNAEKKKTKEKLPENYLLIMPPSEKTLFRGMRRNSHCNLYTKKYKVRDKKDNKRRNRNRAKEKYGDSFTPVDA